MSLSLYVNFIFYKNKLHCQDYMYYDNEITKNKIIVTDEDTFFTLKSSNKLMKDQIYIVITEDQNLLSLSNLKPVKHLSKNNLPKLILEDYVYFFTLNDFYAYISHAKFNYNYIISGGAKLINTFLNINEKIYRPSNLIFNQIDYDKNINFNGIRFSENHINLNSDYKLIGYSEKKNNNRILLYKLDKYDIKTADHKYLSLCDSVLKYGKERIDRTGTGTVSIFGKQIHYDISNSIPFLTIKSVPWKHVIQELLWFMRGDTDVKVLQKKNVKIWNGNSSRQFLDSRGLDYEEGVLGPCFPKGTPVLTNNGFKKIEDISYIDKLYTHTGKWGTIEEIIKRDYEGEMYNINVLYQPVILTTPEHPFYARIFEVKKSGYNNLIYTSKPDWVTAEKLTKNHLIGMHINNKSITPQFNIESMSDDETISDNYTKTLDNIDEWWMFGLFLCNGWIENNKHINFIISSKDNKIRKRLDKVFENFSLKSDCDKYISYTFCDNTFLPILETFGKSINSRIIPEWVHSAPVKYIDSFLDGYFTSVGNFRKNDNIKTFTTISLDVAMSIQRLYLKLGTLCFVRKLEKSVKMNNVKNHNKKINVYEIEVYNYKHRNNYSFIEGNYAWFQIHSCEYESTPLMSQTVYNFSVKEDNTYTVQNMSVHNCYGFQWRFFGGKYHPELADTNSNIKDLEKIGGFDQLEYVEELLRNDPYSRRIMISAWNPYDMDKMALPPCHYSIQFYVDECKITCKKRLNCHFIMRSNDVFLGHPFNISSYAIMTYILALRHDMIPGKLVYTGSDVHIYKNHMEQTVELFNRPIRPLPMLKIDSSVKNKNIRDITINDFELIGYFPNPSLYGEMAV